MLKKKEKKRIKCADVTRSKANESEKLVSKLSMKKTIGISLRTVLS